jgi:hypothetical protein
VSNDDDDDGDVVPVDDDDDESVVDQNVVSTGAVAVGSVPVVVGKSTTLRKIRTTSLAIAAENLNLNTRYMRRSDASRVGGGSS